MPRRPRTISGSIIIPFYYQISPLPQRQLACCERLDEHTDKSLYWCTPAPEKSRLQLARSPLQHRNLSHYLGITLRDRFSMVLSCKRAGTLGSCEKMVYSIRMCTHNAVCL